MEYQNPGPSREELEGQSGLLALLFGSPWCGYCQAAEPIIQKALEAQANLTLIKIEDGPGRKLGRSFKVKLWPTLVFLKDGIEVGRIVRPETVDEIDKLLRESC